MKYLDFIIKYCQNTSENVLYVLTLNQVFEFRNEFLK